MADASVRRNPSDPRRRPRVRPFSAALQRVGAELIQQGLGTKKKAPKKKGPRDLRYALLGLFVIALSVALISWSSGGVESETGDARSAALAKKADEATPLRSPEAIRHQAAKVLALILDGDEADRRRAVAILGNLGPEALESLREEFESGENPRRRDAAAFALAILGDDDDHDVVAAEFLDQKRDPTPLLALAAAELGDPYLVEAFKDLRRSPDATVREAVARAFRAAASAPLAELLDLFADKEPRVRDVAERTLAAALPKAQPDEIRSAAETAAASKNPRLRIAGIRLGTRVDTKWSIRLACKAVRDPDMTVRHAAIQSIANHGDPSGCTPLIGLMEDGAGRREKIRAASALAELPAERATLDSLAKVARGNDPVVALAAARTLVSHKDERGIPALLSLRQVKQSAERRVDHEDAKLLAGLSKNVLRAASKDNPPRRGESWERWWKRVHKRFEFPYHNHVPRFPDHH